MILQLVVPYSPYSFEDKLLLDRFLKTPQSAVQLALQRLDLLSGLSLRAVEGVSTDAGQALPLLRPDGASNRTCRRSWHQW